jgi:acetoin utilization deacetylase AcuC-like enzyme
VLSEPNHAAIAVRHAQKAFGATRVALVDFDVHHGNGSQDIFWADKTVMYASTHQMPLFPGSGATGVRVEPRRDHDQVRREGVEPRQDARVEGFAKQLASVDPLANIQLDEADFGWATRRLMEVADRHAGGRVVSILEGGYSLDGLARSVAAHMDALMGRSSASPPCSSP